MGFTYWLKQHFAGALGKTPLTAPVGGFGSVFGEKITPLAAPHIAGAAPEPIVIAGNCLARRMVTAFERVPTIRGKFQFLLLIVAEHPTVPDEMLGIIGAAEHMVIQDIRNVKVWQLPSLAPSGCEFIQYPQISLRLLWPWTWRALPVHKRRPNTPQWLSYRDTVIEVLVPEFLDPDAMIAA